MNEKFIKQLEEYLAGMTEEDYTRLLEEGTSFDEVERLQTDADALVYNLGTDGARSEAALKLIERLVPVMIDVKLWRDIALGNNVHLPATDQYGPISTRLKPSDPKVRSPARGNAYGQVHAKKQEAPSAFLKRQGQAMARAVTDIERIELELETARQHRDNIEAGLRTYATTCLLTEIRKAAAPVFAMGPAWTLLRAISGITGKEVASEDAKIETHRILIVLHALREHQAFEQDLKDAIHQVCVRYGGEAARRGKFGTEFDGPYDYEEIMKGLKWPLYPGEIEEVSL